VAAGRSVAVSAARTATAPARPRPRPDLAPEAVSALYASADGEIDARVGGDVGFEAMLRATPCEMDADTLAGFRSRHAVITAFHERCLELFRASLRGDCDPRIAALLLGDVSDDFGAAYHLKLSDRQHRPPVFFRTDEVEPGKLSEIQCPGSGWDLADMVRTLYQSNPDVFGEPKHFKRSLSSEFARAVRGYLGAEPVIHHLVDNASGPQGMRYFIQRTRDEGVRYFTYDRDVGSNDCNFVRAHDFVSVLHHNFYADRMRRCDRGELCFDLPPSALFDGKLILAWPFWSLTRGHFGDEVRDLFPYTTPIVPDGIEMEGGERVTIEDLFEGRRAEKAFYVKYAGTDVGINWGSRAVFLTSQLSRLHARRLISRISDDWKRGRVWVIQRAVRSKETISVFERSGRATDTNSYAKWSGFYGPDGLLGIKAWHRRFYKVHGAANTALSIVY
jgi:hypothetical protein